MRLLSGWLAPAAIILLVSGFYFFHQIADASSSTEEVSGAYEALRFFGDSRTYPEATLPGDAYFAAWRESARMQEAESLNRNTDPWETMGPHNRGGRTLALAFNPQNENTLYAGSASGGLWRSYSAGVGIDAWERVDIEFPVLGVSIIEFMPGDSTRMFIGTGEVYNVNAAGTGAAFRSTRGSYGIGILSSSDGGTTWEKSLDFSYDQNKGVWDIEIAPTDPTIIYAATTDGVYKSTDAGSSWNLVHNVVMANDILIHPNDPNKVVVGSGNFASNGFGIYRTEDGGISWQKANTGVPQYFEGKIQLAHAPSAPDTIYASIGNGFSSADGASWLCRSLDFGATWTIRSQQDYSKWQGWFSHDVAVNPNDPDDLTVIGIEVWKSYNGGTVLQQKSLGGVGYSNPPIEGPDGEPDYVHSDAHDVIFHPTEPNVFYVASDGGIHRSLDNGESFASCNGRYQTTQFYNGFSNSASNPNLCMGGLQDNGTIRWNGAIQGVTWRRVNGGDGSWSDINQQEDDIQYVSSQYLNIRRTTNGNNFSGLNIPKEFPMSFIAPFLVAPSDGSVLYAGSGIIAKSTDYGSNWTVTNDGDFLDGHPVLAMSMSYQNTDIVYAATTPYEGNQGSVFVTLDGGESWDDVTGDLPNRYPMDMQVDPSNDSVAYIGFSGYGTGHVYRTTDYGETWTDISDGLPDVPANAIAVDPLYPNNVYVGNDLGVFVSLDYGQTWEAYQDGMPGTVMVFDLKISAANRKLRAASHGLGAFQRDLLEEPVNTAERTLALTDLKVYPNPADNFTSLSFTLPGLKNTRVELLDNQGRMIRVVQPGRVLSGEQKIEIDTRDLPTGIYYVRLNVEGKLATEQLVVQR